MVSLQQSFHSPGAGPEPARNSRFPVAGDHLTARSPGHVFLDSGFLPSSERLDSLTRLRGAIFRPILAALLLGLGPNPGSCRPRRGEGTAGGNRGLVPFQEAGWPGAVCDCYKGPGDAAEAAVLYGVNKF
jgi:hypothetical protein